MAQSAFRGGFAGCAIGDAAEGHNPFGDRVGLFLEMPGHGIEEFVELDEMHSLDVPMGPLHLAAKIDTVCKAHVEKSDDGLTVRVRYAHAALIRANSCSCCFAHVVDLHCAICALTIV